MEYTVERWWNEAKFGLFIHWGLYSLLAGEYDNRKTENIAEWILHDLNIPLPVYRHLACEFDPTGFDAEAIVKLAKETGMKYIVFTSKHHASLNSSIGSLLNGEVSTQLYLEMFER